MIRCYTVHNGHDLGCSDQQAANTIDPTLLAYIEELATAATASKLKPAQIFVRAVEWAEARGHCDMGDRRWFPAPIDIHRIICRVKMRNRLAPADCDALHALCMGPLSDKVVFYQPLHRPSNTPLLLVLQSKEQRDNVIGVKTFFLDASYKGITAYGYAFYALIARAIASGAGTPVGYIITSTQRIF